MTITEPLGDVEVRVLGALLEKEATTPDNYPLTLNALTAACNQSTNREPVMELAEPDVLATVKRLIERGLVREVYRSDSRAKRYRHTLQETLSLHDAEKAVMCVLMLRGAQTAGEIRTRTARMHEFSDPALLDITLDALATLSQPLVAQLPRQPGQKEIRFAHLLSGEPQLPPETERAAPRAGSGSRVDALEQEVASLRTELADLRTRFDEFLEQFK